MIKNHFQIQRLKKILAKVKSFESEMAGLSDAELRTKKGVSARDMSLSIGQNPGYIRAIECGTTFPTMSNFFYICEYLNVTPQEFFNFSEEPSNGMNALTDQLQQFDSEQTNALAAFIKTIVKK